MAGGRTEHLHTPHISPPFTLTTPMLYADHHSLRFEKVTEVLPRLSLEVVVEADKAPALKPGGGAAAAGAVAGTPAPGTPKKKLWASGTGYGHADGGTTFDPVAYRAAKERKAKQMRNLAYEVLESLRKATSADAGSVNF